MSKSEKIESLSDSQVKKQLENEFPELSAERLDELHSIVPYLEDFYEALNECENKKKQYEEWKQDDRTIMSEVQQISDALDTTAKNVGTSKVASGSIGIASGLAIVSGLILAPFTLGTSLGLTIGGIVGGATSGAVSFGTTVHQVHSDKNHLDHLKEVLSRRDSETKDIINLAIRVSKAMNKLSESLKQLSPELTESNYLLSAAKIAWKGFVASKGLVTTLNLATVIPFVGQIAAVAVSSPLGGMLSAASGAFALPTGSIISAGGSLAQGFAAIGGVINIGIGLYDVITGAQALDQRAETSKKIDENIKQMSEQHNEITSVLEPVYKYLEEQKSNPKEVDES